MSDAFKVVIIGGVAAGPKVASRVMRLRPDAQVTLVERGEFLSFAGCGLPYYVMDVVTEQKELVATPAGAVRDAGFFQKVKGFTVLGRTEAVEIDRAGKRVRVKALESGEERWLPYDKLVLATGARPVVPTMPGSTLDRIHTLHTIPDAEAMRALVGAGKVKTAVIVGGGLIGVEVAEALAKRGCHVTIVEMLQHILTMLDWDMAKLAEQHLAAKGVTVLTETKVERFEGEGAVAQVITNRGALPADLVLLSIGVRPNAELAEAAGLPVGPTRAIQTDVHMATSDPDIYAVGDCAETRHLVTGKPAFVPLGSTANKQGRVAANHLCGRDDAFPGVLGSTVCRVFDFCVARTGLTEAQACEHGYDVVTVLVPGPDRPHYMPQAKPIMLKLIIDRPTRKLLGAEAVGPGDGDKRIDVAALAITAGMTVDDLDKVDLCYAPPFSPAMDNLITAADVARNKLDGLSRSLTPAEVQSMLEDGADFVFLDVRSPQEVAEVRLPKSTNIPLGALRARLDDLPKDKLIVPFCKASLRGYEAARILLGAGFSDVAFLDGGVAMWPYAKEK